MTKEDEATPPLVVGGALGTGQSQQGHNVGAGFDFSDPDSPLARFYLRTSHVVAVAAIAAVFAAAALFPLWHTDVWGHLKYGQWMVEHGRIPDREPFSPWWDGRQPFTQFYTLTQLAMYAAYAAGANLAGGDEVNRLAGGVEFLRIEHGFLTAARYVVLLAVFLRQTKSWKLALGGIGLVTALSLSNLAVFRPQTFAELYFALLLLPLAREKLSTAALVGLPLLMAVWANSHGSYVVGLVVPAVLLAGRVVDALAASPRVLPWNDDGVRRLALAWVLCVAAVAFLNPYGPGLFKRTLELSSHPTLIGGVSEWRPLGFEWAAGWHWVFMLSLVAIGLTQLAAPRAFPTGHTFLLLAFGLGVSLQTRFVIWWAMLVPFVLVPRWAELIAEWRAGRPAAEPAVPSLRKTALAVLVAWAFFMWTGLGAWATGGAPMPPETAVSAGTPWQLARQLRHPGDPAAEWNAELGAVLRGYPGGRFVGTVMATPMMGDYLMWEVGPEIPVTYAHMHLFPPDYWEELGVVGRGSPGWWEVLDRYRVNLLVVEAEYSGGLREQLRKTPGWKIVVDETGDAAAKPNALTRHLVAVRVKPL
ncbi:hypothetical protein [Urbifossiella limnaea]|nr:hypothetical protein [Urbifossiella limnaea]